MEQAVASYVKGQFLLSLIIGVSVGLGLWILGTAGLVVTGKLQITSNTADPSTFSISTASPDGLKWLAATGSGPVTAAGGPASDG